MNRICIVGGGGQIGRSVTQAFIDRAWQVTIVGRSIPPHPFDHALVEYIQVDRSDKLALKKSLNGSYDLLLDCLSFDESDAKQLVELSDKVGRICAISSVSVYADKEGRTLDEARDTGFPDFPVPITTSQSTVEPGPATYSTRKIAMEQTLLGGSTIPVTILRPGAIHGPFSKHAREWFFVKRLLDGRKQIPLAYNAESRFHTTAVQNIASAVFACAEGILPPIVNVVDPVAPTTHQIGTAIMQKLGVEAEIVRLPDQGYPPKRGLSPWSIPKPMVCAPSGLFEPAGHYDDLVGASTRYLKDNIDLANWQAQLPVLAGYPFELFDYNAEDEILAEYYGR